MSKNIVICLDGTGNEFGDTNSNVLKLFSTLPRDKSQIAYYHPGVGTKGELDAPSLLGQALRWIKMKCAEATGYGVIQNIADAYTFLMKAYEPNDRVFIFGFSRGAYTARALCSMLHEIGLMDQGCDAMVTYAVKLLKRNDPEGLELAKTFKQTFGIECKPHFVGLWDTVNSVGTLWPIKLPFIYKNPDIQIGRHALSIDEARGSFRPTTWEAATPGQDLQEIWFPGVHSDVGGGYSEAESGLSKTPLGWILEEAEKADLKVNSEWKAEVLGGQAPYVKPDPKAKAHNELDKLYWRLLEYIPRPTIGPDGTTYGRQWLWPRGTARTIRENSVIHRSAIIRMGDGGIGYQPKNLPSEYTVMD